ncbi:hypothetical protein BGZ60DRAFT_382721 [Tricladium varicosporioides]|nr:hypothetical protein BGZ60DRAFT_382721 [Hymenoscyphus varicosporioides]
MVKLIIGLDFGTTFSGVAYAEEGKNEVQLLTQWPGRGGAPGNTEKIPSRISYGPPPQVEIKWGNLIRPNDKAKVHSLMKLKLDGNQGKSQMLRRLVALLSNDLDIGDLDLGNSDDESENDGGPPDYPGKDPVDMVTDYLTEIRKHCEKEWIKQYTKDIYDTLSKEIVVTVPAVWKESAKDATIQAVKRAGFVRSNEKIWMVTEPEAAAIHTLKEMTQGAQKDHVKVGDVFVLCDAGGGTVDLISYQVTQTSPTFRIEEAAVGSGAKCGATFVEDEFLKWLQKWIGVAAYGKIPKEKAVHGSQLITTFEQAKMDFDGEEDNNMITLPRECGIGDDESKNIDDNILQMTPDQMKAVMNPCVNRTLELVDGQVAALIKNGRSKPKVRMVIVVGGFGRNNYLYNRISEYCEQRGILTRRPAAPWSAVVRGAVSRGLEGINGGLVAVRLARKHYGTYASEVYRPSFHHPDDMYIDELTGSKYAKGQMTWLIDKGERLPESFPKKASISVSRSFKKGEPREIGGVLVGCDEEEAPQRYRHQSAYNICRVSADINHVPDSKFTRTRSGINGEEFFVAEVKLEATFSGGEIDWKIFFDREEYGTATVSYDK